MLALHLGAVELRCPGPATPVLRIPELRVPAGDRIAVTGPSGSGKSTLVNITTGLERLRQGQVRWGGTDIARLPEGARDRWRATNVGIVLQKFHLFPAPVPKTTCFCPPACVGSWGEMQRVAVARAPAQPRHHRGRRAHRHPRSRQRRGDRPVAGRACRAVGGHTDPRVERAAPIGLGGVHVGHPIVGATTDLIRNTGPGFLAGRRFAARGEAVVGSAVALAVGSSIVPSHGQAAAGGHAHAGLSHAVTGRLAPTGTPWDRAILVPIQAIWHIHGRGGHEDAQDAVQPGGEAHGGHAEDQPGGKGHNPGSIEPAAPLVERWRPGEAPGLPAILVKPGSVADAYRPGQGYRVAGRTLAVLPGEVLTGLCALLGDARRVPGFVAAGAQVLVAMALRMVTFVHVAESGARSGRCGSSARRSAGLRHRLARASCPGGVRDPPGLRPRLPRRAAERPRSVANWTPVTAPTSGPA